MERIPRQGDATAQEGVIAHWPTSLKNDRQSDARHSTRNERKIDLVEDGEAGAREVELLVRRNVRHVHRTT